MSQELLAIYVLPGTLYLHLIGVCCSYFSMQMFIIEKKLQGDIFELVSQEVSESISLFTSPPDMFLIKQYSRTLLKLGTLIANET